MPFVPGSVNDSAPSATPSAPNSYRAEYSASVSRAMRARLAMSPAVAKPTIHGMVTVYLGRSVSA